MGSMVEGHSRCFLSFIRNTAPPVPLHHLRWSPSPFRGGSSATGRIRSYRPNKTRVRPPFSGTFSSRPLFLRTAQCHMDGMSAEKPWPDSIRAGECDQHETLVRRVLAPNPSPYTFTGPQTWLAAPGRAAG